MKWKEQLEEICENGSEEEKELLQLTVQAIKQKRSMNSAYLSGFMGLSGTYTKDGSYEFRIPITPFMLNRAGIVHGGITASIADSTIGSLINQSLPDGGRAVTTDLQMKYLRPGVGKELVSRAKILSKGQTLIHAECVILDDRGKKVAFATATFYVLPAKR
ncbi:PaaI family thioesterase [Risungbinella massiliensis]|uniref:PaaI family thioesterase n=1 Tax=Risungbinella massiliensis TaxID=1329796 RepID=UPI0005CBAF33|nr:PaaI family thioesterase [Risungbinella massiliensis]